MGSPVTDSKSFSEGLIPLLRLDPVLGGDLVSVERE
jgi:hypothetical protein